MNYQNFGLLLVATLISSSCGKIDPTNTASEDTSASGAAASVVGSALSGSSANASGALSLHRSHLWDVLIPSSFASTACPTYRTTTVGCYALSGNMWLNYTACSFGDSSATWTGTELLINSAGTSSCGTFPSPGTTGTMIRQFVSASTSTTPSSAKRTNEFGTVITVDDSSANLGNFANATVATLANSGYGSQVGFGAGGVKNGVTVARHLSSALFNISVTGTLSVSETAGATTRTVSGALTTYHNVLKVVGTSTFTNVVHSDSCCTPISGSIKTAFSADGSHAPTFAGGLVVGKSETLTFNGCGSASLTSADGTVSSVATTNCF